MNFIELFDLITNPSISRMSDDFRALLLALNSGENDVRSAAEEKYATLGANQKLQLLTPAAADNTLADAHRALAAVLLRRTITGKTI